MSNRNSAIAKVVDKRMAFLPSDYLLQYATTKDLMAEWLALRDNAAFFGRCLKARFAGGGGNPALKEKLAGRMSETEYELVMATVNWYESIFVLVQSGWEYIEQEIIGVIDDYPSSEIEMYLAIMEEIYNAKFQERINGYTASSRRSERDISFISEVIRRGTPLPYDPRDANVDVTSENISTIQKMPEAKDAFWFHLATGICFEKSKSDQSLKRLSRDYFKKMGVLLDLLAKALRQERSKNPPHLFPSTKWSNGERYEGTKGSWKKSVTELHRPKPTILDSGREWV